MSSRGITIKVVDASLEFFSALQVISCLLIFSDERYSHSLLEFNEYYLFFLTRDIVIRYLNSMNMIVYFLQGITRPEEKKAIFQNLMSKVSKHEISKLGLKDKLIGM
jgi:hypothetical protein